MPRHRRLSEAERRAAAAERAQRYRERVREKKTAAQEERQLTEYVEHELGIVEHPGVRPPDTTRRDVAVRLQERFDAAIASMSDEELFERRNQPAIANALRAQGLLDKRKRPTGTSLTINAHNGRVLMAMTRDAPAPPPPDELPEGYVFDGNGLIRELPDGGA